MIQCLSHVTVWVLNQEEALHFYRDQLGLEVRTDSTMESGFRWLTVGPKGQPDFEIVLMEPVPGHMWSKETADQIRNLVKQGAFGIGVFETADCPATYEALKARGVQFSQAPEDRFYGIEAVGRDNSGNWFSLCQRKPH
jgi:catechol 2,3-dioxygenase-like lactoylglutathione lyase family enzyme